MAIVPVTHIILTPQYVSSIAIGRSCDNLVCNMYGSFTTSGSRFLYTSILYCNV